MNYRSTSVLSGGSHVSICRACLMCLCVFLCVDVYEEHVLWCGFGWDCVWIDVFMRVYVCLCVCASTAFRVARIQLGPWPPGALPL